MGVRLSDLRRAVKFFGIELENTGRGKHPFKLVRAGSGKGSYPLKAHGGDKSTISTVYVDGLIRHFAFSDDDARELRQELGLVPQAKKKKADSEPPPPAPPAPSSVN